MVGVSGLLRSGRRSSRYFKGCLFQTLNVRNSPVRGKLIFDHPLDTEAGEYFKVINEILIPDCMEVTPDLPAYSQRTRSLIKYTNPAFHHCWNFGVELLYRKVAPPEHQTEENLMLARLLRALVDLAFTMSAVLDDIADEADERRGMPAWHRICDGGPSAALYDGSILGYLPFHVLTKRFENHPAYVTFMQAFAECNMKMLIGETLDILGQGTTSPLDPVQQSAIVSYKAGHFVSMVPIMGLHHAGFKDEDDMKNVREIFFHLGSMLQVWDDFNDYYSGEVATGKPSCDIRNGGTTWLSALAPSHFTPHQMEIFRDCYGSSDPEKEARVKELYDEINMPELYVEKLRNSYQERVKPVLTSVRNERLRDACHSYLEWCISDVMD